MRGLPVGVSRGKESEKQSEGSEDSKEDWEINDHILKGRSFQIRKGFGGSFFEVFSVFLFVCNFFPEGITMSIFRKEACLPMGYQGKIQPRGHPALAESDFKWWDAVTGTPEGCEQ